MTTHVLILCTHNSARSVLSEGMLNHHATRLGRDVRAHSAGSAPSGRVNPMALSVLEAVGIETGAFRSQSWDDFAEDGSGPALSIVITVCDSAAAEACPVFLGAQGDPTRVHWGYPDPSAVQGSDNERRQAFELTRQAIGYRMLQLLELPLETMSREELGEALIEIGRR